jgi:hypothetical protein
MTELDQLNAMQSQLWWRVPMALAVSTAVFWFISSVILGRTM